MATAFVPVNTAGSISVVTQLVPTHAVPTGTVLNLPAAPPAASTSNRWKKFLKGEPKALGTVQIVIGIITFLIGIVSTSYIYGIVVYSGISIWGSIIYISAGSLAVAGVNNNGPCVVKSALTMNVFSIVASGIALTLLFFEMILTDNHWHYYDYNNQYYSQIYSLTKHYTGVTGVLLVLSLLQFIISICLCCCCNTQALVYSAVSNPTAPNYSITNPPMYNNPPPYNYCI